MTIWICEYEMYIKACICFGICSTFHIFQVQYFNSYCLFLWRVECTQFVDKVNQVASTEVAAVIFLNCRRTSRNHETPPCQNQLVKVMKKHAAAIAVMVRPLPSVNSVIFSASENRLNFPAILSFHSQKLSLSLILKLTYTLNLICTLNKNIV